MLLALIIFACFVLLLTSQSPDTQDLLNILASPGTAGHLLGTDQLGRDTFTRLLYGLRLDLRIAFLAVLFPFVLGVVLGMLAGYFGGWADTVIMRIIEIVVAFPFYVLVIALVFVLGPGASFIYIAITIVGWVSYARIIRGEILVAKLVGVRGRGPVKLAPPAGPTAWAATLLPNVISSSEVRGLRVRIATSRGQVRAVDGVSFAVPRGEAMGLVGESGSGKSMTLRAILGVLPPGARGRARPRTARRPDLAR